MNIINNSKCQEKKYAVLTKKNSTLPKKSIVCRKIKKLLRSRCKILKICFNFVIGIFAIYLSRMNFNSV